MTEKIDITLLGKTMQVVAPNATEVQSLQNAARALDQKLQSIRSSNPTMPAEKIAIMAALNIMHDLLILQTEKQQSEQALKSSLNRMRELVDA